MDWGFLFSGSFDGVPAGGVWTYSPAGLSIYYLARAFRCEVAVFCILLFQGYTAGIGFFGSLKPVRFIPLLPFNFYQSFSLWVLC